MRRIVSAIPSLPSRRRRDADVVKKLAAHLREFDVSRLHINSAEEDVDTYSGTVEKPLVYLATKDTAPCEVVTDHSTAEEREMQTVITNVKERIAEGTRGFYDALKGHHSKIKASFQGSMKQLTEDMN